jgi:hypothetical protein
VAPVIAAADTPVARADAVRHVAEALGLSVRGARHLTGAVEPAAEPPSWRVLNRLLAGYSFALVLDVDGTGELVVVSPDSAAAAGDRSEPAPLWGVGDVGPLAGVLGDHALRVLTEASRDAEADARLTAITTLADQGTLALEVLAAATRDADAGVRLAAMQHLAAAGAPAASHLVAAFHDGADAEIRALALSALRAADPAAARSLVADALDDPDPTVRRVAEALAAE